MDYKGIKNILAQFWTVAKTKLANVALSGSYNDLSDTPTDATTSTAGLLSATDKAKLNGIETGAQVNTVTGVKGDSESTYRTGNVNITKANVGLGNVTNESKATMFTSPAFTGTPTAPTATAGTNTTQIATTAFVSTAIANIPSPMIFKGTLGTSGTISSLPTATSSNTGYTYKVITAGTYESQSAKIGDIFISTGSDWQLIPSGDEPSGTVTNVATGAGLTGGPITTSGTIKANLKSETASSLTATSKGATASREYAVGLDANSNLSVNVPWTDTHYASSTIVGASATATANAAATNGNAYINHIENGTVKSAHNIKGTGATTVTADANGVITVNSTNTTYSSQAAASGGTAVSLVTTGEKYNWNTAQSTANSALGKTYIESIVGNVSSSNIGKYILLNTFTCVNMQGVNTIIYGCFNDGYAKLADCNYCVNIRSNDGNTNITGAVLLSDQVLGANLHITYDFDASNQLLVRVYYCIYKKYLSLDAKVFGGYHTNGVMYAATDSRFTSPGTIHDSMEGTEITATAMYPLASIDPTASAEITNAKNLANATGTLAVANGGTGQTTAQNIVNETIQSGLQTDSADVADTTSLVTTAVAGYSNSAKGLYRRPATALWNYIKGKFSLTTSGSGNAVTGISYSGGVITATRGSIAADIFRETTWSALKTLRDNGELVPGLQYKITDYVTTTVQADTQSAGHQFDIIVKADSASVLNENARAALHSGDTYFASANLEAWKLKYCLDNDTTRFAWADSTNGKGVIYQMIDEKDNDLPYDFKNIQFKRYKMSGKIYKTMSSSKSNDTILQSQLNNGTISVSSLPFYFQFLDGTTVSGNDWYEVGVGALVDGATLGTVQNVLHEPPEIVLGVTNDFEWFYTFSKKATVAESPSDSSLLSTVYKNKFGYGSKSGSTVSLGNNVLIGTSFYSNTVGNNFYSNTVGNYFYYNTVGNNFNSNTVGNNFNSNTVGNDFNYNTVGNNFNSNTVGNYFYYNTVGNDFYSNTVGNYYRYNHFEDGVQRLNFSVNGTSSNYVQKYRVLAGTHPSSVQTVAVTAGNIVPYNVKQTAANAITIEAA